MLISWTTTTLAEDAAADANESSSSPPESLPDLEARLNEELEQDDLEAAVSTIREIQSFEGHETAYEERLQSLEIELVVRRADQLIAEGKPNLGVSLLRLASASYPDNQTLHTKILHAKVQTHGVVPILASWPRLGFENPLFALGMYRLQRSAISGEQSDLTIQVSRAATSLSERFRPRWEAALSGKVERRD